MNNEEAIIVIERHKAHWQRLLKEKICDETEGKETIESFELGISALSIPEREKGEWIELPKALNHSENPCECSKCGHILSFMNGYPKSNFCPDCGADMKDQY